MSNHDSPIQMNPGGGTLAQQIVSSEQGHWSVPDGAILASGVRRTASFTVDVVIVTTILMVVTGGRIIDAWNLTLWSSADFHYALAQAFVVLVAHWLYWRLTGVAYSRSLGQRMLGLAVVVEEQGLGATLAFVVAGPPPNRVHVTLIGLGLRVNVRVTIYLRGRRL